MKQTTLVKRACRTLKKKVEFELAVFSLNDGFPNKDDTEQIKKATSLYMRTWVIPIIDAIHDGDMESLKHLTD